jgi:putative restriction endonuclease
VTFHNFRIDGLSENHQLRLRWFEVNKGETRPLPTAVETGQLLATHARGIFKPKDWSHALSIRIMLESRYKDGEFFQIGEEGWVCAYHQQLTSTTLDESRISYSNLALQACLDEQVPIGILKQVQSKDGGGSKYSVIGLGAIVGKIDDYFVLCDLRTAISLKAQEVIDNLLQQEAEALLLQPSRAVLIATQPQDSYEQKISVWSQVVRRQGQGSFRRELLRAYQNKCCMTETTDAAVLDAAHITPYSGRSSSTVRNGLLIRTDLHTLFDLGLLGIEPSSHSINVHESIKEPAYRALHGKTLRLPSTEADCPGLEYLESKWAEYQSFNPT